MRHFDVVAVFFSFSLSSHLLPLYHSILSIYRFYCNAIKRNQVTHFITKRKWNGTKCRTSIWIEIKWLNGFITSLPYYAWILVCFDCLFHSKYSCDEFLWKTKTCKIHIASRSNMCVFVCISSCSNNWGTLTSCSNGWCCALATRYRKKNKSRLVRFFYYSKWSNGTNQNGHI